MELRSVNIAASPDDSSRTRLVGQVLYDDGNEEQYWFEVDKSNEEYLSRTGNPWLAFLLPLAMSIREPLRLCAPVDAELLRGAREAMDAWRCWFPALQQVEIEAELLNDARPTRPEKTVSFFSGGVDSFYTVLRHEGSSNPAVRIDDLLFVSGFDIPISDPAALQRIREKNRMAAQGLGKGFVDVATNMRTTRFNEADWQYLSHGAALAAIALALEEKYVTAFIAPSCDYAHLMALGSHPATDPLFSTSRTKIVHDGAGATRFERVLCLSESELARQALHICWVSRTDDNCGQCRKCTLTTAILDVLGIIDKFPTLNKGFYDISKVGRIYCLNQLVVDRIEDIRSYAARYGRADMVKAADQSLRLTKTIDRWFPRLTALENRPLVGWPATRIKEHIQKDVL